MATRRQASLFLDNVAAVEAMRHRYDPAQAKRIPAHVTLCREDEVVDWEILHRNLDVVSPFELRLSFGIPVQTGNFVFLPVVAGANEYQLLRQSLLSQKPRWQDPHLTIIHPRDGKCDAAIFSDISTRITPFQYTFHNAVLIEQLDGGVWRQKTKF